MSKRGFAFSLVMLLSAVMLMSPAPAKAAPVNLELALAVDVSGSIDSTEFALQKTGYVNALNNIATLFGSATPPLPLQQP